MKIVTDLIGMRISNNLRVILETKPAFTVIETIGQFSFIKQIGQSFSSMRQFVSFASFLGYFRLFFLVYVISFAQSQTFE